MRTIKLQISLRIHAFRSGFVFTNHSWVQDITELKSRFYKPIKMSKAMEVPASMRHFRNIQRLLDGCLQPWLEFKNGWWIRDLRATLSAADEQADQELHFLSMSEYHFSRESSLTWSYTVSWKITIRNHILISRQCVARSASAEE